MAEQAPTTTTPNPSTSTSERRFRSISDWMLGMDCRGLDFPSFIAGLAERLVAEGVPLLRLTTALPTLHPEIFVRSIGWVRGKGVAESTRGYEVMGTATYQNSPVRLIHDGAPRVRRKLQGPTALLDFVVFEEIAAMGGTDYLALPVPSSATSQVSFVAYVSDSPEGFSDQCIQLFEDLIPAYSLRLELAAQRAMTGDLLRTYLGSSTAQRVLAGTFLRGQCETINAALWFSDLRGFTTMTDQGEPAHVIHTLDDYFETLVHAIQGHGGEVLKFIGDGLLAIFRIEDTSEPATERACNRALAAAYAALAALEALNERRATTSDPPLKTGIALHHGPVMYGNIGARDRLDFTVIGRAVNEVARLENVSAKLERPIVASGAFAEAAKSPRLRSLGFHALKGLREPREVFGV